MGQSDSIVVTWAGGNGHTFSASGVLRQDGVITLSLLEVSLTAGQQAQFRSPEPRVDGEGPELGSGATVAQLTLDQKVEGSNPSSPATPATLRIPTFEPSTSSR